MRLLSGKVFLIFFLYASTVLKAGEFMLKVNDVSGLDSPWPLVASLSLYYKK